MKRRRRKWAAPNNPTAQAKQVWRQCFPGEPWPKGWKVQWAGFMRGVSGLCIWSERRILLNYADARKGGIVYTLLHEFVHMRCGKSLRHGKEFESLVENYKERLHA